MLDARGKGESLVLGGCVAVPLPWSVMWREWGTRRKKGNVSGAEPPRKPAVTEKNASLFCAYGRRGQAASRQPRILESPGRPWDLATAGGLLPQFLCGTVNILSPSKTFLLSTHLEMVSWAFPEAHRVVSDLLT